MNYSTQTFKQIQIGNSFVNKKYTIVHQIHDGDTSKIFIGAFCKNGRQVARAIKIQPILQNSNNYLSGGSINSSKKSSKMSVKNQTAFLRNLFVNQHGKLDAKIGFPHLFQFGSQGMYNYSVMSLYGPNLAQLMRLCGGKFSARTTLLVALQIIDRLQEVHNKKYLYGSVSPQNFLIGLGKESYLIYMIDFSRASVFKSKNKNVHIPYQGSSEYEHLNFDNNFSSINCQLGIQSSRRDDLESFMYLVIHMFKGRLPWSYGQYGAGGNNRSDIDEVGQGQMVGSDKKQQMVSLSSLHNLCANQAREEQKKNILQIKRRVSVQALFKSLSFELIDLMYYIKTLSFYEKPDYNFVRKKLWAALMQTDYQELKNNILIYDWNQRQALDYEIYRGSPKFRLKIDKQKDQILQNQESQQNKKLDESIRSSHKTGGGVNTSRSSSNKHQNKRASKRSSMDTKIQKMLNQQNQYLKNPNPNINRSKQKNQKLQNKNGVVKRQNTQNSNEGNVTDDDIGSDKGNQQNILQINQKLNLIKKIDDQKMTQSIYKDKQVENNIKTSQSSTNSRFKNSASKKEQNQSRASRERKNSNFSQTQYLL